MALADLDRKLLQRCLGRKERAWEDFVDRFIGLVVHVVNHSAQSRSLRLTDADREDLVSEVFLAVLDNDYEVLRHFRGESSLATYLTVIARRVVVRELLKHRTLASLSDGNGAGGPGLEIPPPHATPHEQRVIDREQVEALLRELHGQEADIVRMFHLEGRTYRDISSATGVPENSIGPTLHRALAKMRRAGADTAV